MDKIYLQMRSDYAGKISFRILNWEDKASKAIISQHSLSTPPASVFTDSQGHVVQKFEGSKSSKHMKKTLETLLAGGGKH